jgi:FimV-like protein
MSRGSCTPLLMVALAVPGAAHALGLGDIRVNSALNEPLSAQVDIVGATSEELQALKVAIADEEGFRRYNADRPSYLSTVSVRLGTDVQGRPVLNLHSAAAFTDPVVELLVDVRWGAGELIRDYSLLLDPAEFRGAAARVAVPAATATLATAPVAAMPVAATPVAAAPVAATPAATAQAASSSTIILPAAVAPVVHAPAVIVPATGSIVLPTGYRVRARDTLSRIVRRLGVTDRADAQRMMIALFRDNPEAFDGNINLLHRDALLAMPTPAEIAAIDAAQARRDVAGHMSAWRQGAAVQAARENIPAKTPDPLPVPEPVNETSTAGTPAAAAPTAGATSAEATTGDAVPADAVPASVAAADASAGEPIATEQAVPATPVAIAPTDVPAHESAEGTSLMTTLLRFVALPVVALVLVGLALRGMTILMRRRRRTVVLDLPKDPHGHAGAAPAGPTAGDVQVERGAQAPAAESTVELPAVDDSPTVSLQPAGEETLLMDVPTQKLEGLASDDTAEITAEMAAASGATTSSRTVDLATVVLEGMQSDDEILDVGVLRTELARAQDTVLDYNLVDLDATAQHVHMPSDLNDRPTFVERRTNVAEALRAAIARDPSRNDLRMKLMETYFSTAATNRRAFTEYVRLQASEPGLLTATDWQKVAMMGKELGLELVLPASAADDDLAHCA